MWQLKCRLGDKWSREWKGSSCWVVKARRAEGESTVCRWGGMKGLQRSSRANFALRWHFGGSVVVDTHSISQELLLTAASQVFFCFVFFSWPRNQKSHQECLSVANMLRRSTSVSWRFCQTLFFFCFFLPRVFCDALQTSVGHNCLPEVCLSRALRQRFWEGVKLGLFMSYEKTLKQLMHLSDDVS